ncbi:class II aldolase/adducin family protein [Gynuella sunshinyii]|uniref:Ribulose-5-phosphate 4-epimerase and related epimerase and aldolase n=1 Tax=Gynuella sunshinyii YC6258 TaxID=1445510 RepID=A0A0C5VH85_9GAMM|nr:class II aldolase/adducin family protein [Gynuella sunshinyii]AJQ94012.1 ribulose-5-phosphate 4-epimerase and related epimerase and aldolase [Gynuella sunshinyii YC6258]
MITDITEQLIHTAERLREKKFFHQSDNLISALVPGTASLLYLTPDGDARPCAFAAIDSQPEEWRQSLRLHAQIYQARQDVGAIARLSPQWCRALAQLNEVMPSVFDEQARHIGKSWSLNTPRQLLKVIAKGGNCGTLEGDQLVFGVTLNRMVFNAELFEKCAMAYTLARASGKPVGSVPWWVRLIAGRRMIADEKKAAISHQAGQLAEELRAY